MAREFYDLPYFYLYDADALTDTQSYFSIGVPLNGDSDFGLRRVAGRGTVCAQMQFRDQPGNQRLSNAAALPNDYPVAPQIWYPAPAGQISLDLLNVQRSNWAYAVPGSVPNYWSQLAFQGVRRFWDQREPQTSYKYFTKPYTLQAQFTVAIAGRMAAAYQVRNSPIRVSVPVDNYDFELQSICITMQKLGLGETVPSLANAGIKLVIYAPAERALMNGPIVDHFLNTNVGGYNNAFPAPYVLYPASSAILMDVTSLLLDTEVPATVWVDFVGMWRFPC